MSTSNIHPVSLRCEYCVGPVFVDVPAPRLSWQLSPSDSGGEILRQSAYQILVAGSAGQLNDDIADLWDSGKVASSNSIHITYEGRPLVSRQKCFWKLRVWDANGVVSPWSEISQWSMGRKNAADWQGRWISASQETNHAAVLMRREITLDALPERAVIYVCGLGYHEVFINGRKVGDQKLAPAFTDYSKRIYYIAYDVTEYLKSGRNVLGVMLGGGWYNLGTRDGFGFHDAPWTSPPKLMMDMDFEYPGQDCVTVSTDQQWKWMAGDITFNCVRGGETIDARMAQPGWNDIGYDDAEWKSAIVVSSPTGTLELQKLPPIRAVSEIQATQLSEPQPGVYVYDLGVNIAGWARFRTSGNIDQDITLDFNEQLNDDGTVNLRHLTSHTQGRFQAGQFILKGEGEEVYEPRFTYHGFQYVQVKGLSHPPSIDDLTGVCAHTDPAVAGYMSCSDERINRLHQASLRTYLNNLHSIPTDCPHREKMGWMIDGFMTMETGCFNFDMATFYIKWLRDMIDAQGDDGQIPSIVPTNGWGRSRPDGTPPDYSDPWWGGSFILIAWNLYSFYGDNRVLAEMFPAMKRYVDYLRSTANDLILSWGLGDWLEPDAPDPYPRRTSVALTSTAALFYFSKIVSQAADLLGQNAEAERFSSLAAAVRDRFNAAYLDDATGLYAPDSQTAQVLAICLGIVPEDKCGIAIQRLVENIHQRSHLSTGFIGTPFLLNTLTDNGYDDLAYKLVVQESPPSWWNLVKDGDSTLRETWLYNHDNSFNHPGFGCVDSWFFTALAGIRLDPDVPAFARFCIKPQCIEGINKVTGRYESIHGTIMNEWQRDEKRFCMSLTIPPNTEAVVYIPTGNPENVKESGKPAIKSYLLRFREYTGGYAVFDAAPGRYQLTSELE